MANYLLISRAMVEKVLLLWPFLLQRNELWLIHVYTHLSSSKLELFQTCNVTFLRFHSFILFLVDQRLEGRDKLQVRRWRNVCLAA